MFNTTHNQNKAEEIVEKAKQALDEAERRVEKSKKSLLDLLHRLDTLRLKLINDRLPLFRKRYALIEGEETRSSSSSEQSFTECLKPFFQKAEIPIPNLEPVEHRKKHAFIASVIGSVVTIATAFIIAAIGTGKLLTLDTFLQKENLLTMLTWLGGGAYNYPWASPIYGAVGIVVAFIAVWMTLYALLVAKTAKRNLTKASKAYDEASLYAIERKHFCDLCDNLTQQLASLEKALETCDVYMEEYNGILRRILYTEGEKQENYTQESQEIIKRAKQCEETIVQLMNIPLLLNDSAPSKGLDVSLEQIDHFIEALVKQEPLPTLELNKRETVEAIVSKDRDENKESLKIEKEIEKTSHDKTQLATHG